MLGLRPEWPSAVLRNKIALRILPPKEANSIDLRRPVPPNRFAAVVAWLEALLPPRCGEDPVPLRAVRISEKRA